MFSILWEYLTQFNRSIIAHRRCSYFHRQPFFSCSLLSFNISDDFIMKLMTDTLAMIIGRAISYKNDLISISLLFCPLLDSYFILFYFIILSCRCFDSMASAFISWPFQYLKSFTFIWCVCTRARRASQQGCWKTFRLITFTSNAYS